MPDKLAESKYHLRCLKCAFRVHDTYFIEKKDRFAPGICPNCGSPIYVVDPYTDDPVPGAKLETDPKGKTGHVVEV